MQKLSPALRVTSASGVTSAAAALVLLLLEGGVQHVQDLGQLSRYLLLQPMS